MRSMLLSTALAFSVASSVSGTASAQSVGGHYTVQGQAAFGGMYAGVAQIGFRGEECVITWHLQGGAPVRGVCMLQGRVFSVGYVMQGAAGVAVYEVQADGSLRGRWSVGNGVGTESLYPR